MVTRPLSAWIVLRMSILVSETAKFVSQMISPSRNRPSELSTSCVTSGKPATPM